MTKEVTYTCNLCLKQMAKNKIIGLWVNGSGRWREHEAEESDVHICMSCLADMGVILNKG